MHEDEYRCLRRELRCWARSLAASLPRRSVLGACGLRSTGLTAPARPPSPMEWPRSSLRRADRRYARQSTASTTLGQDGIAAAAPHGRASGSTASTISNFRPISWTPSGQEARGRYRAACHDLKTDQLLALPWLQAF